MRYLGQVAQNPFRRLSECTFEKSTLGRTPGPWLLITGPEVTNDFTKFSFMLLRSVVLFVVAGLFEIGGGYLVWQWWRNGAGLLVGAYGGWFVVLSILWG